MMDGWMDGRVSPSVAVTTLIITKKKRAMEALGFIAI
jgi:hypothetical protein